MKRKLTTLALATLLASVSMAQSFDIDLTKEKFTYNETRGQGYDVVDIPAPGSNNPFYYSVKVPDGNYLVTVTLGDSEKDGKTLVRAEQRRLMVEETPTKKGESKTVQFVVSKRSPQLNEGGNVNLKDRELGTPDWDEKLTLEFNGEAPAVKNIKIEPTNDVVTLFLCGDSTVTDQAYDPYCSWGQMLPRWFNSKISVSNHAESGLTARSFLAQQRLDKVFEMMKPGDYVFIQFGHNDEKEKSLPNYGAYGHYYENLALYIDKIRAKGGNVVLMTPTARRRFEGNSTKNSNTHGDFPDAVRKLAAEKNVPLIDLTRETTLFLEALGSEQSKKSLVFYPAGKYGDVNLADNTHWNPYGAYEISKMVVTGIKNNNLPLEQHLLPDFKTFNASQPDSVDAWKWYDSAYKTGDKPDGN